VSSPIYTDTFMNSRLYLDLKMVCATETCSPF